MNAITQCHLTLIIVDESEGKLINNAFIRDFPIPLLWVRTVTKDKITRMLSDLSKDSVSI